MDPVRDTGVTIARIFHDIAAFIDAGHIMVVEDMLEHSED
eukprot:CAMPEP_0184679444 /NCGR_PEP_ID=MMETSP0312-20130426/2271_1 /TAXON_ID=31354 /ORGANISM="Compsopogon coeruleus, Strain SAG 36.94" /LENGTH=39 /DNA_ID= /DNA_START= /DNA_END= /DNA_ORIENTATION=